MRNSYICLWKWKSMDDYICIENICNFAINKLQVNKIVYDFMILFISRKKMYVEWSSILIVVSFLFFFVFIIEK